MTLTAQQQRRQKNERAFKRERRRIGGIKDTKPARDPAYLEWIRGEYCLIGMLRGSEGCSPAITEAAHVGDRGLRQKCPDAEAIPLCARHHRTAPDAHHRLGRKFWEHHGLDRKQIIRELWARYDQERAA